MFGVTLTSALLKSENELEGDRSTRDMLSIFWPFTLLIAVAAYTWDLVEYLKEKLK
jgi:hypothetical protein